MKLSIIVIIGFVILGTGPSYGQEGKARVNYDLWASVLKKYVDDQGRVNYKILKKDSRELKTFINQVENLSLESLSADEVKTFWINAYNAITLKVVLDKYPVKSIRHINFGLVWEVPRKAALGKYSLGHIEHKILRPLGDPRIHFAINCASIGCPKLPNKPFYPNILDKQLDDEARRFINDPDKVRLDRQENTLYYSAIFDWFEEDFLAHAPSIKDYIMKYINESDRQHIAGNDVEMKALNYDWGLNKLDK